MAGLWDVRLVRRLVRPLRHTGVRPNHLTTLGLLTGLGSGVLYASGEREPVNWGAGLFLVTALLDHADGELARLTGRTSTFGHHYDRFADLAVKIAVFTGMGTGLGRSGGGAWPVVMGLAAGVAVCVIFTLRSRIAARRGTEALRQPSFAGFEVEDLLYLVVPATWLGYLGGFVLCAGIGAPLFALWVLRQYAATSRPTDGLPPS